MFVVEGRLVIVPREREGAIGIEDLLDISCLGKLEIQGQSIVSSCHIFLTREFIQGSFHFSCILFGRYEVELANIVAM